VTARNPGRCQHCGQEYQPHRICPKRTAAGGIHCWPAEHDGTTFQIAPGLFLRPGSELSVPLVDLGDDPYGED